MATVPPWCSTPRLARFGLGRPWRAGPNGPRVDRVSFVNVPSFVLASAVPVNVGGRTVFADVAFGGAFYAIVDAESVGLPIAPASLTALREAGMRIKEAVESVVTVVHPDEPGLAGIYGTIFTGPASDARADLRNVTVFAEAEVDRSPCGTGTCAVLAVLDAMGIVEDGRPFVHESIIGTTFSARVAERVRIGDRPAIVPELSGDAWITGEHTFVVQPNDPLAGGFQVVAVLYFIPASLPKSTACTAFFSTSMFSTLLPSALTTKRLATTTVTSPSLPCLRHFSNPGEPASVSDLV